MASVLGHVAQRVGPRTALPVAGRFRRELPDATIAHPLSLVQQHGLEAVRRTPITEKFQNGNHPPTIVQLEEMTESNSARTRGIVDGLGGLSPEERYENAAAALGRQATVPLCPFQAERPPCSKAGGVCSIQQYQEADEGKLGEPSESPVIVCPSRFEEGDLLLRWLGEIVGFSWNETLFAREVAFMEFKHWEAGVARSAGDGVVRPGDTGGVLLPMTTEFESALNHPAEPTFPDKIRRPDWLIERKAPDATASKVPTLRRWGSKLAVAVDRRFFDELGGPSNNPSHDLDDGDIIWLVPELLEGGSGDFILSRGHWEVLTLEESSKKPWPPTPCPGLVRGVLVREAQKAAPALEFGRTLLCERGCAFACVVRDHDLRIELRLPCPRQSRTAARPRASTRVRRAVRSRQSLPPTRERSAAALRAS